MRILYSHRIQSRDGQSVHLEELISAFRAAGHEVLVVGPAAYDHSSFGGESQFVARVRRLLPAALQELAELAYNVPAYLRLRRAWRQFRPDLVYERYNLFYLAGAWLARWQRAPLYLEVNAPLAAERAAFGGLRLVRLAFAVERFTWRAATRVLPVTGVLRDIVIDAGASSQRVHVVPNGIALERFTSLPPRVAGTHVVLGFVGFMRAWHGLDVMINALAEQEAGRGLALIVVGDGPVREDLERQAADLGISDRVQFPGVVPHDDVPGWVGRFDIALQPRVTEYASPLKIFDYMAAGCAIVAPDQPNIREVLRHGATALLFDPADPNGLWEAVRMLAEDPALRVRLGEAARAELEARNYTWQHNAARIAAWARARGRAG
jgi:glycosyltransferase involved in cell wall biosynthesis